MSDQEDHARPTLPRLESGSVFAGYRIDRLLDRGGMGVVYNATDADLDRNVALKIIAPEHTQNATAMARFKAESRLAASLEHPNIVPDPPRRRGGGVLYLAMRYVPGTNLRRGHRPRSPGPSAMTGVIMTQLASALDAAHARGLVHRDVKPANILISEETATDEHVVPDRLRADQAPGLERRPDAAGAGSARPTTSPPSRSRATRVDRRADVYSLGCVLYEMLTGEVAYPKDSDMAKLWAHVTDPPPLPRTRAPTLVRAFDEVVARATTKEPEDRYATAGEMAGGAAGRDRASARRSGRRQHGAASSITRGETLSERRSSRMTPPLRRRCRPSTRRGPVHPDRHAARRRAPSGCLGRRPGATASPPDPPPDVGRGRRGPAGGAAAEAPRPSGSASGGGWHRRDRGLLASAPSRSPRSCHRGVRHARQQLGRHNAGAGDPGAGSRSLTGRWGRSRRTA